MSIDATNHAGTVKPENRETRPRNAPPLLIHEDCTLIHNSGRQISASGKTPAQNMRPCDIVVALIVEVTKAFGHF